MKTLLAFVIASVFACGTRIEARPQKSAHDWLNQIEEIVTKSVAAARPEESADGWLNQVKKLFTDPILSYPAYQLKNETYPPIEEDVIFWCAKPNQNDSKQVTLNDPDVTTKLDLSKPINFFIHGWLGFKPLDGIRWFENESIRWAHFEDCNACTVDWNRLARYNYSISATKHVKMVSNATVNFINFLIQHGMNIQKTSIAGFSLGAQIAGFIGAAFPEQKLSAIYGLDPSGPGFTVPRDFGISERLDPTDATYVQCIFTNQYVLGSGIDCGHGNYFMNGGMTQPGCHVNINCSHRRAYMYFDESFDPEQKFVGEKCENASKKFFLEILGHKCSDVTDRFGIYTSRKPGRFFVKTNSEPPFAQA